IDPHEGLESVSCPTTSFCVAVDESGYVLTYNGSSWSSPDEIDPGTGQTLTSVSCPTASFCVAVDMMGNVLTYNGSSWSSPESIGADIWLYSVSCPAASSCVAVGFDGDVFTYSSIGTLTQGTPTSASVADG